MKRLVAIGLLAALCVGLLTGCGDGVRDGEMRVRIVCETFPAYDWVRQLLGDYEDEVALTLLLDSGADMHSYQPTAADIIEIADCDLFVMVGGVSDTWAEAALQSAPSERRVVVRLLEVLGEAVKTEEVMEGMETHTHELLGTEADAKAGVAATEAETATDEKAGKTPAATDAHTEESHAHETEYDEHVWLSLKHAGKLCEALAEALALIDEANAEVYRENASAYIEQLNTLDAAYQTMVDTARFNTVLFGDRFPFRYLIDDYGLKYYAAFAGCSAETEASFETVAFLAGKLDELGLDCVLTLEGTQHTIAQTVIANTERKDQTVLVLDSMQSVTAQDIADGAAYLAIMEHNLEVLTEALN